MNPRALPRIIAVGIDVLYAAAMLSALYWPGSPWIRRLVWFAVGFAVVRVIAKIGWYEPEVLR